MNLNRPVALQLYTVRRPLVEDLRGTLQRVYDLGYRAVETYPFPAELPIEAVAAAVADLGLEVVAMHGDLPTSESVDRIVAMAAGFRCRQVIWHGWPRSSEHDSLPGLERLVESYNRAAELLRSRGLEFGLHNHWWEFEPLDGMLPWRIFHERLDPQVFLEVDVYWAQTAGMNPAAVLAEFRERVRFLHLKDGPAVPGEHMTAIGQGTLDFSAILNSAPPTARWVVELDECAGDIFQAVGQSLQAVRGYRSEPR